MKNKSRFIAAIVVGSILFFFLGLYWIRRKEDPEVLLSWLRKNKGNRDEILMQLNMVRGDAVSPMITAYRNTKYPVKFRADVLELLYKKQVRAPEARIESVLVASLNDTSFYLRKRAVLDMSIYGQQWTPLIPFITDPDPEIRKIVYMTLSRDQEDVLKYSVSERQRMVKLCLLQRPLEKDSTLIFLNHTLIGCEIYLLCYEARVVRQQMLLEKADSLLERAMALDSTNKRPWMVQAEYLALNNRKEEAKQVARDGGILIEIPRLAQTPKIDGDPEDPAWKNIKPFDVVVGGNMWAGKISDSKTKLFLGHLNGKIYLAFLAYEADMDKIVITQTRNGAKVYVDDCLEMMFNPTFERKRYFKFVVNAGGYVYQRYSTKTNVSFPYESTAKLFKDRGYWSLEFVVSGKDFDNHPVRSGEIWNMSIVWGRKAGKSERNCFWYDYDDNLMPVALFK